MLRAREEMETTVMAAATVDALVLPLFIVYSVSVDEKNREILARAVVLELEELGEELEL